MLFYDVTSNLMLSLKNAFIILYKKYQAVKTMEKDNVAEKSVSILFLRFNECNVGI